MAECASRGAVMSHGAQSDTCPRLPDDHSEIHFRRVQHVHDVTSLSIMSLSITSLSIKLCRR